MKLLVALFVVGAFAKKAPSSTSLAFEDSSSVCKFTKDGDTVELESNCDLRVRGSSITSLISHVGGPTADKAKLDTLFGYVHQKDCPAIVGTNHLAHVGGARTHGNGFCRYNCKSGFHDEDKNNLCTQCLTTCSVGYKLTGDCKTDEATKCEIISDFCPASISIDKGSIAVISRTLNAEAVITCNTGENHVGSTKATCGTTGEWSIGDAVCGSAISCIDSKDNGDITGSYTFTDGSKRFCDMGTDEAWTQVQFLSTDTRGHERGYASVFSNTAKHSLGDGGSYKLAATATLLDTATKFRYSRAPSASFNPAQSSGWDMDVECEMTTELRNKIKSPGHQNQPCATVMCKDRLTGASFSRFANYQGWGGCWNNARIAVGTTCNAPHYHVNYCSNCAVTWKCDDGTKGTYNAHNVGTQVTAWWLGHGSSTLSSSCNGRSTGVHRLAMLSSSLVFCQKATDTAWTQIQYLTTDSTGYSRKFASVFSGDTIGSIAPVSTSERSYKVDATSLLDTATKFRYSRAPSATFDPAQSSGWDMDVECEMTEALRNKIKSPGHQNQPCASVMCKDRLTGASFSRFANYQSWGGCWNHARIAVGTTCNAPHYHVNYCANCAVTWKCDDGTQGTYNAHNVGTQSTAWWLGH